MEVWVVMTLVMVPWEPMVLVGQWEVQVEVLLFASVEAMTEWLGIPRQMVL